MGEGFGAAAKNFLKKVLTNAIKCVIIMTSNKERGKKIMPNKLTFVTIFPEYADKMYEESTYLSPEYTLYRYLILEEKTLSRLARVRVLLTAPETFYARDILEEKSKGGIINGLCQGGLITETGNKQKYYIELDDKRAIIGYAKEWKLVDSKDRMILAYNRIRNEILKLI